MKLDYTNLATLALPYFDDITDETTMHEYIDDAHIDFDDDDTLHRRLATALGEDIVDLLHNGNGEDLDWTEGDEEDLLELTDEGYPHIDAIALLLSTSIIARIYA